jgi:hypothetical protein
VLQAQIRPEWQPAMNCFSRPKTPLGGFDLAFRMKGDGGVTVAAETKWSGGTGVDALDQTPWDVLKLIHSRTIDTVRWALLITAAPDSAWEKARFAPMFDEHLMSIGELLSLNSAMYVEDSTSRPLKLPPFVQSSPTVRASFVLDGKSWQIRVASIRANGEPWLDCDEEGWPLGTSQRCSIGRTPSPEWGWRTTMGRSTTSGRRSLYGSRTKTLASRTSPAPRRRGGKLPISRTVMTATRRDIAFSSRSARTAAGTLSSKER